jgi:CelD/BcsL family acetyltransferase involved in cellulose biosynthesis
MPLKSTLTVTDSTVSDIEPIAELRVYRNLDELQGLRTAWDELLSVYPLSSTFSTWEWLSCWWRSFGRDRALLVLALFGTDRRLDGLALFSISEERFAGPVRLRVLRLMGDGSADSDNLDLPVRPGFEQAFAEVVFRYLEEHRALWDLWELSTLPVHSPVATAIAACAASGNWRCCEYFSPSSAILLPDTWEQYLGKISSEDRKNLVRYTKRLNRRYKTEIYRVTKEEEMPRCLDALFRLHQERWQSSGEAGSFSSSARQEFYDRLSRCLLSRGWLELWVVELDGEIAAVQFAFRYRDTVYQLQEGYDHSRPSDRIGYVLRGEVLQQLISERVEKYDFLGGEDAYKARWGAEPSRYRRICFARALTLAAFLLWATDASQRSKNWLRRTLPSPAWELLHRLNIALRGGSGADPAAASD